MDQNQALFLVKHLSEKKIEEYNLQEVEKLQELIAYLSELYYELETPLISDSEYDMLFAKLKKLEETFGVISGTSQKVGSELAQSSFEKIAHSRPMISLDNTYNAEDLRDFDARVKKLGDIETPVYMLEFKFDGLGVELVYEDGVLVQAITRGNGLVGEDITQNVKQIKNIPQNILQKGRFEVRGEVVMPISSFERLNAQAKQTGEKIFSNPRNAASGSLRVLDIEITKKRDLKFFAYDVSDLEALTLTLSQGEREQISYQHMIYFLQQLGFEISSYFKRCQRIEEVIYEIEHFGDIKKQIDFEIDGLVLKLNDMSLWKTIGFTEHHPRYAIAYKFPAEIVTTTLLSVEHSVGRTGTITPVANLEAVNIGGAIIRRSTLHNYEEVEKLGIKVGDRVFLKRAGEVIPKIIGVASSLHPNPLPTSALTLTLSQGEREQAAKEINLQPHLLPLGEELGGGQSREYRLLGGESSGIILPPASCPSCGAKVAKDEDKVRYYCPNSISCPAQMVEKFAFAVGKHGFDIDNFGEKQAELFVSLGWLKNLGDIFRLKNYKVEMLELEGFQEKSVNNLLMSIEEVRKMELVTFLKALGIPGVGKKTAKTLAKYFQSGDRSQETGLWEVTHEELEALADIGPEVARSVVEFFQEQRAMIEDVLEEVEIIIPLSQPFPQGEKGETANSKWQGKKMCITGSFEGYSRDGLVKILEDQGGEFMSSVSVKTDYLLAGEKAGSKLVKAQELGVKVLSLSEFLG